MIVWFEELPEVHHAALFVVDYHLTQPPDYTNRDLPVFTNEFMIMIPGVGSRFKYCAYKVGSWSNVLVVWPRKWAAPAANALGWLPKLEFGDPTNPPYYTTANTNLPQVAPFRYLRAQKDMPGNDPAINDYWYDPPGNG